MKVRLYSDDEIDMLHEFEAERYSEISKEISIFENETGDVIDYVQVETEEDCSWHYVNEDLRIELCETEVQVELNAAYSDDMDDLVSESGWFEDLLSSELEDLEEQLKRRVTSTGQISRVRSRQVRSRRAVQTTGMSKTALKRRARKAARTRRRDVGGQRRAVRKRKKAMRRRRQLGVR